MVLYLLYKYLNVVCLLYTMQFVLSDPTLSLKCGPINISIYRMRKLRIQDLLKFHSKKMVGHISNSGLSESRDQVFSRTFF